MLKIIKYSAHLEQFAALKSAELVDLCVLHLVFLEEIAACDLRPFHAHHGMAQVSYPVTMVTQETG